MKVQSNPEYCLGCGLCQLYCAAAHDGYDGNLIKAFKKGSPQTRAVLIKSNHESWLNTCRHCQDAPCINACLSGALQRDDKGIVFIDSQRCVGCFTCVMVCPFGHIQPSRDYHRAVKCDLCRDRSGTPACVSFCPNGALRLTEEMVTP